MSSWIVDSNLLTKIDALLRKRPFFDSLQIHCIKLRDLVDNARLSCLLYLMKTRQLDSLAGIRTRDVSI